MIALLQRLKTAFVVLQLSLRQFLKNILQALLLFF